MADRESFIGKATTGAAGAIGFDVQSSGFKALSAELKSASKVLNQGLVAGAFELATGGGKVKAVWESIKWGALTRAGLAGFAALGLGVRALTGGIRAAVKDSGALQAAMERLSTTKILTTQFTTFMGSVEAAKKRVSELYAFAANTKFNFDEIAQSSRALTVFSNGTLGGSKTLEMLGKISNATGVELNTLSEAYGRLNQQARNNEDITGTVQSLRDMGVISESTASHLATLSKSGAPPIAVWEATQSAIEGVSDSVGETTLSIEELEQKAEKAGNAMLAAFAKEFLPEHRRDIEATGKAYENLTGAVAEVGRILAAVTEPFAGFKTGLKEVAGQEWFGGLAKSLAQILTMLPLVAAGAGTLKGIGKALKTGFETGSIKGIAQNVLGAVMPSVAQASLTSSAARQRAGVIGALREAAKFTSKGMDVEADAALRNARALKVLAEGTQGTANVFGYLSKALGMLRAGFMSLARFIVGVSGPLLLLTGITVILTRVWTAYQNTVARREHTDAMTKAMEASNVAIDDQIKKLKTLDDHLRLVTTARQSLNDALEKQGQVRGDLDATDEEKAAADAAVANARRNLRKAEQADTGNLSPGEKEIERLHRRVALEQEIKDIIFQSELARATGGKQALMWAERQRDMLKKVAEYKASSESVKPIAEARTAVDQTKKAHEDAIAQAEKNVQAAEARAAKYETIGGAIQEQWDKGLTAKDLQAGPLGVAGFGAGLGERALADKERTRQQVDEAKATLAKLRESGSPDVAAAEARLAGALGKGSRADRYEAEALTAQRSGRGDLAAGLQLKAVEERVIGQEQAEKAAEEARQQLITLKRQGELRKTELATQEAMLQITSESFQAEEQIAKLQQEELDARFAKTSDVSKETVGRLEAAGDKEGADAVRVQQANFAKEYEIASATIKKQSEERTRQRERETAAWTAMIEAGKQNAKALVAAAAGNYKMAAEAIKAAQKIEDTEAQRARRVELTTAGESPEEIERKVGAEQKDRERQRTAGAEGYRIKEERRIKELELENKTRGIGGGDREKARKELTSMRDQEMLGEKIMEGIAAGMSEEEARKLAVRSTKASILAEEGGAGDRPGSYGVADTLTSAGLGGGIYAGPSGTGGDPALETQKRIADLNKSQDDKLEQILKKLDLTTPK